MRSVGRVVVCVYTYASIAQTVILVTEGEPDNFVPFFFGRVEFCFVQTLCVSVCECVSVDPVLLTMLFVPYLPFFCG